MSHQLDLLRARTSETSRAAVQSIQPHLAKMEQRVLDAIRQARDGLTIDELAVRLNKDKASVSPRLRPLRLKGRIFSDGTMRRGRSGRRGVVWKTVE